MPEAFDPTVQESANGALTQDFQRRIVQAKDKHGFTYWQVARAAGISGGFLGNVTRNRLNIGTWAVTRLAEVISKLEDSAPGADFEALFPSKSNRPDAAMPIESASTDVDSIEYAIATLRRHGLGVILLAGTAASVSAMPGNSSP